MKKKAGKPGWRRPTSSRLRRATKGLPVIPEKLEHFFYVDFEVSAKARQRFTQLTLGKPVIGIEKSLQTRVTPAVKKYAKHFQPRGKGLEGEVKMVEDIVHAIANLEMVKVKPQHAEFLYGKRTAEEVLSSGKIPAVYPVGIKRPSWGCSDQVNALIAVLKAKGIKADYVRTVYAWWDPNRSTLRHPHAIAYVHLGNRRYIADPFLLSQGEAHPSTPMLRQVGLEVRQRISQLRKDGLWWPGRDAWGLGIRNFFEYNRHIRREDFQKAQKDFQAYLEEMKQKGY